MNGGLWGPKDDLLIPCPLQDTNYTYSIIKWVPSSTGGEDARVRDMKSLQSKGDKGNKNSPLA